MPYKNPERQREARRKYEREKRQKRYTEYTGFFYEDACPNWLDRLESLMVPSCVSPLHDADRWTTADVEDNPERVEGGLKKPHRHFVIKYEKGRTYSEVLEDLSFLGCRSVQRVKSMSAVAKYLIHDGWPDKAQYPANEVVELCGASWAEWSGADRDARTELKAMRKYIRDNDVCEPADFHDYCDAANDYWSYLLDTRYQNSVYRYIDRNRYRVSERTRSDFYKSLTASPPQGEPEPRTPNPLHHVNGEDKENSNGKE